MLIRIEEGFRAGYDTESLDLNRRDGGWRMADGGWWVSANN